MPFTQHRLVSEGKGARCTLCQQTWTSRKVRSECPGVPVYPYEQLPAYLKTQTALERERKYPPDLMQWDGAYRILKSPYYRLVYDERKAIHKPLTEKQRHAVEKQQRTIRERYGCKLCDTYYRKEDAERFQHGICLTCRNAGASWNRIIEWARHLVQEEPLILDIFTDPACRTFTSSVTTFSVYYDSATNTRSVKWHEPETYLMTGYRVYDLVSGCLERKVEHLVNMEDIYYLRYLICPQKSALLPFPLVLAVSNVVAEIAYRAATSGMEKRERNPNMDIAPLGSHDYARVGRSWKRILQIHANDHVEERAHLEHAATICGLTLEEDEPTGLLLRRFVLHLANQDPVDLGSEP